MEIEAKILIKEFLVVENKLLNDYNFESFQPLSIIFEESNFKLFNKQNSVILATIFMSDLNFNYKKEEKIIQILKNTETNKEKQVFLEFKAKNEKLSRKLMNMLKLRKNMNQFKGPLSYSPAKLIRPSLLSSESPSQNYRGILNLMFIILFATNFRLVMENFLKYGWLIKWVSPIEFITNFRNFPCLSATLCLPFFVLANCKIGKMSLSGKFSEQKAGFLYVLNSIVCLVAPNLFIYAVNPLPIPALVLLMIMLILTLKLISFSHVLYNTRSLIDKINKLKEEKKDISIYINDSDLDSQNREYLLKFIDCPENIVNINHAFYFIACPTLCFQYIYPRSEKIRKVWLLKRIGELIIALSIISFIIQQYVMPLVENAVPHMKEGNFPHMLERLLKLSIPNLYIWIFMFLAMFHLWFNITSEILRYGDRQFYLDWWNCPGLTEYWKLWNLPVRNFFIRHLYNPLLKRGYSKSFSLFIVFFISAVGHEYLVSASLGILSFYAFMAMMGQVPSILFQSAFEKYVSKNPTLGNIMFWISFCFIGQPVCVFIYYYLYLIKYSNF